ncbi:hypothetical protein MSG28_004075 [Choristoneura fumiferana]|uniref:Uncharacterized protein n=1 Tax=Choristoneura fumiferana TaxID=7141 RepID=A0ACC0KH90_CHOFU|nr:hypothetical protein MSG28_004075 [Choristoneura fumiferana]
METDKMSTASSVGAERRPLMQALVLERRILFGCTILVGLSTFLWITAVCTSKWVHIEGGNGILINTTYFMSSDSGVWEICRNEFDPNATASTPWPNGTVSAETCTFRESTGQCYTLCTNYLATPVADQKAHRDPAYNVEIANLVRTMTSFGIIGLFVMAMGCGFSLYTFRNPRYMFKRLAAGIHFISTSCTFVVVQVMNTTVEDLKKSVPAVFPVKAYYYFHISFYLAVFVVLVNFGAAASFLWYSRKRKGDKAATDELAMADEPTIIGR